MRKYEGNKCRKIILEECQTVEQKSIVYFIFLGFIIFEVDQLLKICHICDWLPILNKYAYSYLILQSQFSIFFLKRGSSHIVEASGPLKVWNGLDPEGYQEPTPLSFALYCLLLPDAEPQVKDFFFLLSICIWQTMAVPQLPTHIYKVLDTLRDCRWPAGLNCKFLRETP